MAKVVLQPCASGAALRHYADTIRRPVALATLRRHLGAKLIEVLEASYPSGAVPTWGVTPSGANPRKWQRLASGDVVLFSRQGRIFASGVVREKATSKSLAVELWGRDDNGQTWEYLYFLDSVTDRDIPYAAFNTAVGYAPNFVIQSFQVLREDQSERVLDSLSLSAPVSAQQFQAASKELGVLDKKVETLARTEQAFLRKVLFGNKPHGQCGICGRVFPVNLLVAAHIKQRAECSDNEKADYQHNVMPVCVFGCDDLFERGYIGVVDGVVVVDGSRRHQATEAVTAYLGLLKGRSCTYWSDGRIYFAWHSQHHGLTEE